jgi:hypothetical protein
MDLCGGRGTGLLADFVLDTSLAGFPIAAYLQRSQSKTAQKQEVHNPSK